MSRPSLFGRVAPNGSERAAERFTQHGLNLVISIPGTQVLPLWDAIDRTEGLKLVVPRSERSAGFIAEGYGLSSGRPAVVVNTLGPGVANEAIAVASAAKSMAPVLYFTPCQPQAKRSRLPQVFQGLDHSAYMAGAALDQSLCDDAAALEGMIDAALGAAMGSPTGPVRLDVAFPVLFRRTPKFVATPLRKIASRPPLAAPGKDLILALEDSSLADGDLLDRSGLGGAMRRRAVHPGIDSAGSGLSFALGLRLGRPRSPVVVATTVEGLLAQLGVAVVANSQRVGLTFAAFEGSSAAATVRKAAEATGAAWMPIAASDDPDTVRAAFGSRSRGLTVLVDG